MVQERPTVLAQLLQEAGEWVLGRQASHPGLEEGVQQEALDALDTLQSSRAPGLPEEGEVPHLKGQRCTARLAEAAAGSVRSSPTSSR